MKYIIYFLPTFCSNRKLCLVQCLFLCSVKTMLKARDAAQRYDKWGIHVLMQWKLIKKTEK